MNSDSFSGSWFSSRLNLILADSIVHSQCPINLLDPYISIPSHKIIRRAISCLDENYAIYLPAYEQSPQNHITIFKTSYPEYLKNILEEELTICLGSSEILSDTSFNNHTSNTMYYAVRDSMFIVSKNALSIVKSEQDFKWLQQKWHNSPQSNGELVVSVFHIQQLASIPNDIVLTGKLMGNVMENRLILQFKKADKDPNGLTSILHLLNYLYTYNSTFYDWLDKPKDDVIL
jgi:hypothetical protein